MVIYGTPIMQTFHFKYKLIRIYLSLYVSHGSVVVVVVFSLLFFLLFSQIKNDSKSNWTHYVMHDIAKNHPSSSLTTTTTTIQSIFFWVGLKAIFSLLNYYCKRVFLRICIYILHEIFHLMKRVNEKKNLSFEWYACMVIAPYLICCWSWF